MIQARMIGEDVEMQGIALSILCMEMLDSQTREFRWSLAAALMEEVERGRGI